MITDFAASNNSALRLLRKFLNIWEYIKEIATQCTLEERREITPNFCRNSNKSMKNFFSNVVIHLFFPVFFFSFPFLFSSFSTFNETFFFFWGGGFCFRLCRIFSGTFFRSYCIVPTISSFFLLSNIYFLFVSYFFSFSSFFRAVLRLSNVFF